MKTMVASNLIMAACTILLATGAAMLVRGLMVLGEKKLMEVGVPVQ